MQARFAVVGNPIAHSKSPIIHKAFAEQTNIDMEYTAELVGEGDFSRFVDEFCKNGGKGLNVTVPFKIDAFNYVAEKSKRAELAGAVNTISFSKDGSVKGDNTDGIGMIYDIKNNNNVDIEGKRVLILGAGGAVRGVVQPLLQEKPLLITIANRTVSKAKAVVDIFANRENANICACSYIDLDEKKYDVVINGTSAGLSGEIPPIPSHVLSDSCFCYDMLYGDKPTSFIKWSMDNGVKNTADGLGMLIEQAAESFLIWNGVRPDTKQVMQKLFGR